MPETAKERDECGLPEGGRIKNSNPFRIPHLLQELRGEKEKLMTTKCRNDQIAFECAEQTGVEGVELIIGTKFCLEIAFKLD